MVDRVSSSIVRITGEKDMMAHYGPVHSGYVCSGFVFRPHQVLTAHHCLGENLRADGVLVKKVLKIDEYYDLALLAVDTQKSALVLRDTPVVRFEPVTAIGYAWGWNRLTVLQVRVFLVDMSPDEMTAPGLITQGGAIGGMSGGPVVDSNGQVVCIVQHSNEGIGHGVGVQIIRVFLLGVDL
jgi:S1-C subfamily serine protease